MRDTEPRGAIWIQRPGIRDEDDAGEPDHHYVVADEDHPDDELDVEDYQGYKDQENDS